MSAEKKIPKVMGVDEFLNHSTRSGGGAYLSGWKKEGSIVVWLHTTAWASACWNHPIPSVQEREDSETKEKRLEVWSDRWVCHEDEEVIKRQYYYDRETGKRELPPLLCPMCKVAEAVRDLYRAGTIRWTDPVFEWKGDAADQHQIVLAGGIDGSFGAKEMSAEKLREMRVAGVRRDEAFKQDLRAKLKYMFVVVDDSGIDDGLQKTFEAKGLGEKLKKAIRDEIRRARSKTDPEGRQGNPTVNPYPFEWTFDEDKSFDDKYDVLARTAEKPTEKLLALLRGPPPAMDRDLEPGNCFSLRVGLEEHCVLPKGMLDFDACFAAADKAGLMVPPEETKGDQDEGEGEPWDAGAEPAGGGRVPEVRGAAAAPIQADRAPTVTIGASSPAWTTAAWKPGANVRGADVVLDAPDGVPDDKFNEVRAALRAAGAASVAEAVMCNHCRETMTTLDPACPACGAGYDDDGKLLSRPCLAEGGCIGQVPLDGEGPRYVCEKCGTLHEGVDVATWKAIPREPAPAAAADPPRRARGRGAEPAPAAPAPAAAPPPGDDRKRGVPFDQPTTGKPAAARARR